MTDLDDLLAAHPASPETAVGGTATPRKCRRHRWGTWINRDGSARANPDGTAIWRCMECGAFKDEQRSRRSRNNRSRGNAIEREWAKRLGMTRTGHFGGADDAIDSNGLFVGQAKSMSTARFPGWMSNELAKLRIAKPSHIPLLGILEAPGPGRRPRRLVVLDEADWCALHVGTGPEAA